MLNVWKDNYKKSMDGLKMPPQLKDKIIKDAPKRLTRRRRKLTYARRLTGGAVSAVICCLLCFVIAGYQAEQSDSPRSRLPYPQVIVGDSGVSNEETVELEQSSGSVKNNPPYIRSPRQSKFALAENLAAGLYPGEYVQETDNGKDPISSEDLQLLRDLKIPQYIPDGYVMSNVNRKDKGPAQITYESPNDTLVYNVRSGVAASPSDEPDNKYMSYTVSVSGGNTILLKSSEGLCYNVIWVGDDGNTYSMSSESGLAQETVSIIVDSVSYVGTTSPAVSYEINQ